MKVKNALLLFTAAFIWGIAFVWQDMGADVLGPFSFSSIRFAMGGVFLFFLSVTGDIIKRAGNRKRGEENPVLTKKLLLRHFIIGGIGGIIIAGMTLCQQGSFVDPGMTTGKCGFITATYILMVPVIRIIFRKSPPLNVWIGVFLGLVGLYFLCLFGESGISWGDLLVLLCALLNSVHILIVDRFVPGLNAMKMSCIQCFTVSIITSPFMFFMERPSPESVAAAMIPMLLCGILSSGIAYTLQLYGQKGVNPTPAAMIMSLEAVFSVLAGAVVLNQILPAHQIIGCVILFAAIILAQLPPFKEWKKRPPLSPMYICK